MTRGTALLFAGVLLSTAALGFVPGSPPSGLPPPPRPGIQEAALPASSGSPPPVGIVADTLSTTSGALTAGNDAGTLNQLGPNFLAYDPAAGKIFVSYDPYSDGGLGQGDAGGVAVINSSTGNVTGNIVDGIQPDDVLYDPDNGYVYAVDWRSSEVLVIDPTQETVLTTIDTGSTSDPVAIALDPVNDHLFVTVSAWDVGVEVIDGSNNTIIDQLAAGAAPWWDVYDPANGELYVENAASNNLSVFNASTGATVTSIQVSNVSATGFGGPIGYAPSDGDLFVPVVGAEAAIVSGATNTVIGTIPTLHAIAGYWGFAFDPYYDGGAMLTSEWGGANLTVINATAHPSIESTLPAEGAEAGILVAGSPAVVYVAAGEYGMTGSDRILRLNASTLAPGLPIQLGTAPSGEVYDPNTGCMEVALKDTGQVLRVNVATGQEEGEVSVGAAPASLAFDPVDGNVYVANFRSDNVSILNTTGVVGTVPVGAAPMAVVADPGSGDVYVANRDNSTISVLSGGSLVRSFPVEPGAGPDALAFDETGSRLFVVNDYLGNVSEYDPANGALQRSFPVGADPVGIALDPDNQELYVLSASDDTVNVSSATTTHYVGDISVGDNPRAISFDPANGLVYVANAGDDDLSAIDPATETVLGTLDVGVAPGALGGLAPDGPLGSLYVSNWLSGSLTVVATGSVEAAVQFEESGLPVGSFWSVTFNGSLARTSATALTFYSGEGMSAFAIAGPVGYAPHPASGSVTVTGPSLILSVQFYPNSTVVNPPAATPLLSSTTAAYLVGAVLVVTVVLVSIARRRRRGPLHGGKSSSPPDGSTR